MTRVLNSLTLAMPVACPPDRAYAYIADGANLPKWATAFVQSVRSAGNDWIVETPAGPLGFRFVPPNNLGVLDHYVKFPDGSEVYNPMRVIANGDGCEVIFTLFQPPAMSDEQFQADARMLESDLKNLRTILEGE